MLETPQNLETEVINEDKYSKIENKNKKNIKLRKNSKFFIPRNSSPLSYLPQLSKEGSKIKDDNEIFLEINKNSKIRNSLNEKDFSKNPKTERIINTRQNRHSSLFIDPIQLIAPKNKILYSNLLNEARITNGQFKFNSKEKLNDFLIKNHKISDYNDPVNSSKFKFKMTEKLYEYSTSIKDMSQYVKSPDENGNFSRKNRANFITGIYQTLISEDVSNELKKKIKLKNEPKNIADLIAELSDSEYEEVDFDCLKKLNYKNLNRIVKVRTILKNQILHRKDRDSTFNSLQNTNIFEERINKKVVSNLGPPKYLKTQFKKDTNLRYQSVSGYNFGRK